ncbi:MAG TPA: amino acid adenylation domain-containing protein, partial [Longimicrobiaceae bacterium]|nr:amino acid adenylation domain-containing protein [Longimicrobiaceae bacterium]
MLITPVLFNPYSEAIPGALAGLRHVLTGGDRADPAAYGRLLGEGGPRALLNCYGPTETTTFSIAHRVESIPEGTARVPIGRPNANTRVYVLDRDGEPAPVGVAGELHVGGAGLALGYLNRPELTAERFVPDLFGGEPGARLYRTGDLVRWLPEGSLEFLGRTDRQVKVRGFRIEPGEVEARLRAHAGVREAVVVAREDAPGDRRLVTYWVGEALEAETLRAHLLERLPEHMVPAAYVRLEEMPLTPNGKLDRRALPAPEGEAYARRGYEAPVGEVERALAEVWAEVLKVERVGRWDNFFALGGHSLLAIALIERMRRVGLFTDVRALFTTPVLAELAKAAGGESHELEVPANGIPEGCGAIRPEMLPLVELSQAEIDLVVAGVPGGAANVQDVYPLAPLQEGILFHHLMAEQGDPYLTPSLASFDTRERLEQYLAALQAVIDRHDILRTAIRWEGLREPVQVVWRRAELPVEEVQLDEEGGDAAEQLWRRYDPRRYRMDLGRAPLLRACIAEDRERGRWLLLLLVHHLTGDHESHEVLRDEISAHLQGRVSELPPPLPFRSYVAQTRLGVSREEQEAFFRELLGDVQEPTAPYGLLDVWGEGRGIGEAQLEMEKSLPERLRARARELGVSAASLCHLAWALVLARLTGRQDVVFGTVLFGRTQGVADSDRVMGLFINTLPVRIGVGAEAVEASVRKTHGLLAELLRHDRASLALAQRCSGVPAPGPLFTSLLNYRYSGRSGRSPEAGRSRVGVRGIHVEERTNYPVMVVMDEMGGGGFLIRAQVAAPVEAARVCRMMHTALERLVEALEVSPWEATGTIDVLPEMERRQVLQEWNATEAAYPQDLCVHELFQRQVRRSPDAVAVVFEGEQVSYAELNRRANRLAHHLVGLGVGPDARVAICAERSVEMVVGLLAVLKAGGAYVPLDPEYPRERLAYMLRDSAPAAVLTVAPLRERLGPPGVPVLDLAGDAAEWAHRPASDPDRAGPDPRNAAYVIYTSGSTGRPKGVQVTHANVVRLFTATEPWFGFGEDDVWTLFHSYAFDFSVWEIWGALLYGGRLVVVPWETSRSPEAFRELLVRERVTVLNQTPSAFRQLIAEDEAAERADDLSLRYVVFGGEALEPGTLRPWTARHGTERPRLVNMYGITETTVHVTYRPITAEDVERGSVSAIGRAIPDLGVYVLDPRGEPSPVGVPGEMHVAGAGLARGYLGRAELTAERFVPDSFGGAPGGRLYRSGDLARWLPTGELEYLGRIDAQVKVRGFRIELGEVEARLLEHPGVREAVVVARKEEAGEKRLVAYWAGPDEVRADGLRAYLAERLPEYMVPAAYVHLDALPLTPNGKVDRRALPAPERDAYARRGYEAPQGEVEQALAETWAEVLKVERVGRWDHFFELGGHSLLAVQVASRVRQRLGVEVPLGEVFRLPVLAEYARAAADAARADLPPIEPAERTAPLPLSFAQQRLWFLEQMGGVGNAYHVPWRLRLRGELDRAALRQALDRIVARHEALRTTFSLAGGEPVQRIAPVEESRFSLVEHDLRGEADAEEELRCLLVEEWSAPFDLERGPLIRGRLVRLGEDEHVLQVTMHHVVSDGWSMGVFTRELSALYAAFGRGEADPLPELPVQYADYAVWQRRWVEGEVLRQQAEYWRWTLSGAPELLELPADRPRPVVQDHAGASLGVALDEELTAGLKALSRRQGTTLFMTLLAGWAAVLSRLSGQEDLVVGTPTANRGRREIEGLIGFFVNTLALRLDLSGAPTVGELLERV